MAVQRAINRFDVFAALEGAGATRQFIGDLYAEARYEPVKAIAEMAIQKLAADAKFKGTVAKDAREAHLKAERALELFKAQAIDLELIVPPVEYAAVRQ